MIADLIPILEAVPNLSGRVEIAVSPAEAMASNRSGPWVWLTQVRGRSERNSALVQVVRQQHSIQFSVLSMVQNATDMRGGEALRAMEAFRPGLLNAVLGFVSDAGYTPAQHVSDQIVHWADGGKLYWIDLFETSHQLRKTT